MSENTNVACFYPFPTKELWFGKRSDVRSLVGQCVDTGEWKVENIFLEEGVTEDMIKSWLRAPAPVPAKVLELTVEEISKIMSERNNEPTIVKVKT